MRCRQRAWRRRRQPPLEVADVPDPLGLLETLGSAGSHPADELVRLVLALSTCTAWARRLAPALPPRLRGRVEWFTDELVASARTIFGDDVAGYLDTPPPKGD